MLPRERVIKVINHEKPDRIPIYGWLLNLREPLTEPFGSLEAFEDKYEFDFAHLFGNPWQYTRETLAQIRRDGGEALPQRAVDAPMHDPNDMEMYKPIVDGVQHHR